MICYLTSYRFYILSKLGFGLAYLWFIWDFFRIHSTCWSQVLSLFPPPVDESALESILTSEPAVWIFLLVSPVVSVLYFLGRGRWLQFSLGCWMSFSMISMTTFVGCFVSTADVWLNFIFLAYSLTALLGPSAQWEAREPGFSFKHWHDDPVVASTYAWLVVWLQFNVYVFAGINKLVDGWTPWTTGTAIQNLAFDSSMRAYASGIQVPYAVSLILCYVTLAQRLVVPFGFFFMRYRGWSVLILGAMHVGYDAVMQVNIFPVIGLSSLLMIIPPRSLALPLFSRVSFRESRTVKRLLKRSTPDFVFRNVVLSLFSVGLLVESVRLVVSSAWPWENRLVLVPAWRMFADGGVSAGKHWRLILQTPQGEVDVTEGLVQLLPHLWRDRFYLDNVLHSVSAASYGAGLDLQDPQVARLLLVGEKLHANDGRQQGEPAVILGARFAIYENR